jgi:predicted DNA-binding protein (MmcQ/YjbR family)
MNGIMRFAVERDTQNDDLTRSLVSSTTNSQPSPTVRCTFPELTRLNTGVGDHAEVDGGDSLLRAVFLSDENRSCTVEARNSMILHMDAERTRTFLKSLPHVVETVSRTTRWGDKLVFRVGDQAQGGKMFSQIDFEEDGRAVLSFAVGTERFQELIERDGVIGAPYRARLYWIALMRWNAIQDSELKELLRDARARTFNKLPKRIRDSLTRKMTSPVPGGMRSVGK